jgi:hypothetical protein
MVDTQTTSLLTPSSSSTLPYAMETFSPLILAYLRSVFTDKQSVLRHQFPSSPPGSHPSGAFEVEPTAANRDFNDFCTYMASTDSNAARPHPHTDLTWPMSNYFINSSHNTYLTGNQLYSESSTEAYTNVCHSYCRLRPSKTRPWSWLEASRTDVYVGSPARLPLYRNRCVGWRAPVFLLLRGGKRT